MTPVTASAAAQPQPSGKAAARFDALAFAYFAAIGLFNPYAPLWFQSLGFSTVVIGAIASLQSWTRVLSPYAWSWSGDHSGRRVVEATPRRSAAGGPYRRLADPCCGRRDQGQRGKLRLRAS